MSSVLPASPRPRGGAFASIDPSWLLALAGFAAMYVPVWWAAGHGIWQTDDNAHGALILGVLAYLFWSLRKAIDEAEVRPARVAGTVVFGFGLLLYAVARIADVLMLAIASQPFIVAGILLLLRGTAALKVAWFPIFWFIFMIPLPGSVVDQITGPLTQVISLIVAEVLWAVGYPIARSGVVLEIGQYQMLVAEACSGLHSMYSLSALGTLFMYITKRPSLAHNAIMLASILPIAFVANLIRVFILVLITYHLGDEAGQGFLHGTAGMVLMMVALVFLFTLDWILERALPKRAPQTVERPPVPSTP